MTRLVGIVSAGIFVGCSGGGGISDPEFVTDSVGLESTGTTGEPEGVDETADGGVAVTDHCLFDPMGEQYGYRYQCGGSMLVDVVLRHPGVFGFPEGDVSASLDVDFGNGVDGDSYDRPKVMACCPIYELDTPNCEQDHERACVIDLVEQGCKTLVGSIEDFAHDAFPGVLDTNVRKGIVFAADFVRDHQQECVDAFRVETGIAEAPATCDEEGNGVGFSGMLETGVWAFDPPGPFSNVEITVPVAGWTSIYPVDASPAMCWSADENDGVVLSRVVPDPDAEVRHLVGGNAMLVGPQTGEEPIAVGKLSPMSTLAFVLGPHATLEQLELHAADVTVLGGRSDLLVLDELHLRLWDRTEVEHDAARETLRLAPGRARFAVSASIAGAGFVVVATNDSPIVFRREDGVWSAGAFSVAWPNAESWTLAVGPTRWQ